jgi:pimeloyl-ACP methyl ester carboxylesterase
MLRPILASTLLACTTHAASAATAPTDGDRPFAHPQQRVDIGGRSLNLYCSGSGPVTVVFDAPGGDAGWSWHRVQPTVAARTRACVYDRAGMGFSDPSPLPSTSGNTVNDLHALLQKAGVRPPYVLVGNSFGGENVQLYAYRYPDEVKGLVLVEAGHEDEFTRLNAVSQGKLKQMYAMGEQRLAQCGAAAGKGFDTGSDLFQACTGGLGDLYSRELAAARLAVMARPAYWQAAASESGSGETSDAELKAARRSYGDLPLVVLTRSISPFAVPGQPQSALNKAFEAENAAIGADLAKLSTSGAQRIVPGAGHVIQNFKPDAVAQAVFDVLDRAQH